VNTLAILGSLRMAQRKRLHVCFVLWKAVMARRLGMDAMAVGPGGY
jgi:hypothetical protein